MSEKEGLSQRSLGAGEVLLKGRFVSGGASIGAGGYLRGENGRRLRKLAVQAGQCFIAVPLDSESDDLGERSPPSMAGFHRGA
jgi:hypothetical protein